MGGDRRAAVTRVLADEPAVIASFMATITREIPAYATLDARQLEEVRSIMVWTLRRVLDLWVADGSFGADDLRLFRGVGSVRARDGRPLAAVLRAYRVVAPEFLERVAERFADDVTVRDVTALTRVWLSALDQLSEAITDGYASTGRILGADRRRSLQGVFVDLLLGRQSHAGTLQARLRELDARLPSSFDLVVVNPPTGTGDAAQAAALVTAALDARVAGDADDTEITTLHRVMDGVGVALVKAVDVPTLIRVLHEHGLTGALLTGVTAGTAPRYYRLAVHGIRHAPPLVWAERLPLDRGDLEVLALTAGHPDADPTRLRAAVLGPLADDEDVLRTLETVIYRDGATQAAARLHIHPQTVRYRMRRLAAATSRDPRTPWNRFTYQTALLTTPHP
ncbi:helix-turn-helix domain-containing protein [Actinocorallia sp. API 0066]|uniref:helix-turn-helix domain-containing protein n=1 Tax=Actinocorallia sp. API 0066 TaxID=2896846 RepID=UPI001E4D13F1|nr:helix-turn-helix domain-containing protein [Actinocorallia sp. API 0066]MCD0448876.1 helix-turn-helix domain-containing protein [Actinocorallia sp. API 0066]